MLHIFFVIITRQVIPEFSDYFQGHQVDIANSTYILQYLQDVGCAMC